MTDDVPTDPETPAALAAAARYFARPAPIGARAFDTVATVSHDSAVALVEHGFEVAIRYATSVTASELEGLTSAGLMVAFVLYSGEPGYQPSALDGASRAQAGVARLRALDVPAGVTVFVDAEQMGGTPTGRLDEVNAAADVIHAAGYIPGAYIGAGVGLTSPELFGLRVRLYWKSMSRVIDRNGQLAEPMCGWACVQAFPPNVTIAGVQIDCNEIFEDYAHRTVMCCAAE